MNHVVLDNCKTNSTFHFITITICTLLTEFNDIYCDVLYNWTNYRLNIFAHTQVTWNILLYMIETVDSIVWLNFSLDKRMLSSFQPCHRCWDTINDKDDFNINTLSKNYTIDPLETEAERNIRTRTV